MGLNRTTRVTLSLGIAAAVAFNARNTIAAPPASAPASQPALDRLLDDLARIDPKLLNDRLAQMRGALKQAQNENAALKAKLAANDQTIERLNVELNLLDALIKARAITTMPAGAIAAATQPTGAVGMPPMPPKSAAMA